MAGKDEDRMGDFSFRMTSLVWFKPWWKVFFRPFIGWEGFIRHPGLCPGFVLRTACSHPAGVGSDTRHRSLAIFLLAAYSPIPTTTSLTAAHGYSTLRAIITWVLPILLNVVVVFAVVMLLSVNASN